MTVTLTRRLRGEPGLYLAVCNGLRHAIGADCQLQIRVARRGQLHHRNPRGDALVARWSAQRCTLISEEPVNSPSQLGERKRNRVRVAVR